MKKAFISTAVALTAALSFNAAVAGEPAPVISKEREATIRVCMEKLDAVIERADTRIPGNDLDHYYYQNEVNTVAIKTAIQSGNYKVELARLSLLDELQTAAAFNLVTHQGLHCALFADENGDLDKTALGRELIESYVENTQTLVRYSHDIMGTVKHLKAEGDKLIAAGVKPADKDAMVFLFN